MMNDPEKMRIQEAVAMTETITILAEEYPQLYLNPDTDAQEVYRRVVLQGETPEVRHLAQFPPEEQAAEFRRFTSVRKNYLDMLVVLSRGPYSGVSAEAAGCSEEEWLALSDTIRRYHELTHVICRRLYPDDIDVVRDELIADAVGLYAAYGYFDPEKEKLFLGIRDGQYIGGRLENYTDDPAKMVGSVCAELERIQAVVKVHSEMEPFELIPVLMK